MPEVKFKAVFDWGDEVYVKTDAFQEKGIIVTIGKDWNGGVIYKVKFCDESYWYQAIELSLEKNALPAILGKPDDEEE